MPSKEYQRRIPTKVEFPADAPDDERCIKILNIPENVLRRAQEGSRDDQRSIEIQFAANRPITLGGSALAQTVQFRYMKLEPNFESAFTPKPEEMKHSTPKPTETKKQPVEEQLGIDFDQAFLDNEVAARRHATRSPYDPTL